MPNWRYVDTFVFSKKRTDFETEFWVYGFISMLIDFKDGKFFNTKNRILDPMIRTFMIELNTASLINSQKQLNDAKDSSDSFLSIYLKNMSAKVSNF